MGQTNLYIKPEIDEVEEHDKELIAAQVKLLQKVQVATDGGHAKVAAMYAEAYALISGTLSSRSTDS